MKNEFDTEVLPPGGEIVPLSAATAFADLKTEIAELSGHYSKLVTNGPEDQAALSAVKDARSVHRNLRLAIEKRHKAGKAEALKECQLWDDTKRELLLLVVPQENRLKGEEQKVTDEVARREEAEAERGRAAIMARLDRLHEIGAALNQGVVSAMDDDMFEAYFEVELAKHEERKEQERLEAEEAAAKAKVEADRVAAAEEKNRKDAAELAELRKKAADEQKVKDAANDKAQAEVEAKRKAQQDEEDRLRKEFQRLEDEKRAEQVRVSNEAAAAERKRLDAEAKVKREAATLKARCVRDGEAIMRLAALMDDGDFMTKDAIEMTAETLLRGVDALDAGGVK